MHARDIGHTVLVERIRPRPRSPGSGRTRRAAATPALVDMWTGTARYRTGVPFEAGQLRAVRPGLATRAAALSLAGHARTI